MKNRISVVFLTMFTILLQAQEHVQDSVKIKQQKKVAKAITNQFPSTRFLDIQYEQLGHSDYESKLHGNDYESGSVKSQKRLKVAVNFPILKKERWNLSTSLRYKYESVSFENVDVPSSGMPFIAQDKNVDFHYLFGSLNYTRYDKLFGKSYISNLSVFGDGSNEKFGMINATYLGSFILKKNDRTTLTAGFVAQTNPNSIFPILPTFSYSHKFYNSPWEIDVILPKQVYIRRQLLEKGRLSVGTELDGSPFYFSSDFLGGEQTYNFNRNDIKTGLIYEYKVDKNFITSFRTGINTPMNGTIRQRGETQEIARTKFDPTLYFNFGVSYNLVK